MCPIIDAISSMSCKSLGNRELQFDPYISFDGDSQRENVGCRSQVIVGSCDLFGAGPALFVSQGEKTQGP